MSGGVNDFVIVTAKKNYDRKPPSLLGAASDDCSVLAYFYDAISERIADCPPEGYTEFENCYLYEGSYLLTREGNWVNDTVHDFHLKDNLLPVLNKDIDDRNYADYIPANQNWPDVVISKAGYTNYGHIMTEILPKLVNVEKAKLGKINLILPEGLGKTFPDIDLILAALGIDANLIFTPAESLLFLKKLMYFGRVSMHNRRKSLTLINLRDSIWDHFGISPIRHRRLFVCREKTEFASHRES